MSLLAPYILFPSGGGGGGYTQNFVDTQGNAGLTSAAIGGNEPALCLSFWFRPNDVSSTTNLYGVSGRTGIGMQADNMSVTLKDTANVTVYGSATSNGPFSVGNLYHVYIGADFAGGTLEIKINGVDATMGSAVGGFDGGNGLTDMDRAISILGNTDCEISDLLIFDEIVSSASLYNGGTPPDPTTFTSPSPRVLVGADMTADERGGNTAQGWNDGYNIGVGGAFSVSNSFIDV